MRTLPQTQELCALATRVVWWKPAADALAWPEQLAAYALTYGSHGDVELLRRYISDSELLEAIDRAGAGIIDARSWSYWNLRLGRYPPPPLPERRLG